MTNGFNDPFAPNQGLINNAMASFGQAVPREEEPETRSLDDIIAALDSLKSPRATVLPSYDVSDLDDPSFYPSLDDIPSNDFVSSPMPSSDYPKFEPTAFQRKEINWSDGGRNPNAPAAYNVPSQDFLEVDYEFGKKSGATVEPVRAANIFGRQFTSEELMRDEDGQRLLKLMQDRRSGEYNKGGSLANFVKGITNWSMSDIPFYGWITDLGTTATEAMDISRTIEKLQNGEKVTPHEAIAFRRYMLESEMEGNRTMAYNVGSLMRQSVPFMAEIGISSAMGSAIGSLIPGLGTVTGGVAGAIVGGLKWLFKGGKAVAGTAMRKVVTKETKNLSKKFLSTEVLGSGMSLEELRTLYKSGFGFFDRSAREGLRKQAVKELGDKATRKEINDWTRRKMFGELAESPTVSVSDRLAKWLLVESDKANAIVFGATDASKRWAAGFLGSDVLTGKVTARQLDKLAREGYAKRVKEVGVAQVRKEYREFMEKFSKQTIKGVTGKDSLGTAADITKSSMQQVLRSDVDDRYVETVTKSILDDAAKNFELRFGEHGFFKTLERFLRYSWSHARRALLQSEYGIVRGGAPTIAHSGWSSFYNAYDSLMEGLGRAFIQAPIQAGIQLGVQTPFYLAMDAIHGGNTVTRGTLGVQTQALLTGDRDKMDSARSIALGQKFAEYWSEAVGRSFAPILGGIAGAITRKAPSELSASMAAGRKAFMELPLTREAGSMLNKACESVFGFKDVRKMSLGRVAEMANAYVASNGYKNANKADILKIINTKSLNGIDAAFAKELNSKGVKTAKDFVKKAVWMQEDMTRGRALRSYIGYYLMQKGMTPDGVIKAFRRMGKGENVLEEMGEERFGDFIKGLMHVDDSASSDDLLSKERLKNMFGSWIDGEQLATEFLGFALPGIIRGSTFRLQSWMGTGAMQKFRNASETAARITNAASSGKNPGMIVEGIDEASQERLFKWNTTREELRDKALNTAEVNRSSIRANASSVYKDIHTDAPAAPAGSAAPATVAKSLFEQRIVDAGGDINDTGVKATIANLNGAKNEEDLQDRLETVAKGIIDAAGDSPEALAESIKVHGGEAMFGTEGVEAIRKEWRKINDHEFDESDSIEQSLKAYKDHIKNGPGSITFEKDQPESTDDWVRKLIAYTPFAGRNNSPLADELDRASGGAGTSPVALVSSAARSDLVEAMDTISLYEGRAQSSLEPRMSFGRRVLTRIAGIPAAILTGDLSFAAANPARWMMADAQVPVALQGVAYHAYIEGMKHGFHQLEKEFSDETREAISKALDSGHLMTALQDVKIDRATLQKMEEAGAEYRRTKLDQASQSYLAASGVMTIAQSDLTRPATNIVRKKHEDEKLSDAEITEKYGDEIEQAKSDIVNGAMRTFADETTVHFTNYGGAGRNGFKISIDCERAIKNGTSEEVLAAILNLPAFKGVFGVINVSDNAEITFDTLTSGAFANTVDATHIAELNPGEDGEDLSVEELGEVMVAMRRDNTRYDEAENRKAAARWIRIIQLMNEGSLTTFSDKDGKERSATVRPTMKAKEGSKTGKRQWTARITEEDGKVTSMVFDSYKDALDFMANKGFIADHKRLIVTSVREVMSSDATSMMYFRYGHDQQTLREVYLREIGGEAAVESDLRGEKPLNVDEYQLPPYIRKVWEIDGDKVLGSKWEYDTEKDPDAAEKAAEAFRAEKRKNSKEFQDYEKVGETHLSAVGVIRTATDATSTMGFGSSAFVCRADAGFNNNALVIAPDYNSNGDTESMLRASLRLAINSSIASKDGGLQARQEILMKAYDAFMKAKNDILESLRTTNKAKYDQLKEVVDRLFPENIGRVSTWDLATIAAASIFFTSERGLHGTGNGYFGAPELAYIADEFRASEIFPVFVSAIDEMLGGDGLFQKEAGSVNGLARYLYAFASDAEDLAKARQSSLFNGGDESGAKRNPYLTRISYQDGKFTVIRDIDGHAEVVNTFKGDVRAEYIKPLADSCHLLARSVAAEDGVEGYTTAQMYERMKRAGMFGGASTRKSGPEFSDEEGPALSVIANGGDGIQTEAGRMVAARAIATTGALTLTPETAKHIGAALYGILGTDEKTGRVRAQEYMRNVGISNDIINQILTQYDLKVPLSTILKAQKEEANDDEATADAVASGEASTSDVYNHERNVEAFAKSKDARTVSEIVKWFFPMEGGDVSAIFARVRASIGSIATLASTKGPLQTLTKFAQEINPVASLSKASESLAKNEFAVLYKGDSKALTSHLNKAIDELMGENAFEYAMCLSAINSLPHARKLKLLDMMAQLTPTDVIKFTRRDNDSAYANNEENKDGRTFRIDTVGTVRNMGRVTGAMQNIYTSILSTRFFQPAINSETQQFNPQILRTQITLAKQLFGYLSGNTNYKLDKDELKQLREKLGLSEEQLNQIENGLNAARIDKKEYDGFYKTNTGFVAHAVSDADAKLLLKLAQNTGPLTAMGTRKAILAINKICLSIKNHVDKLLPVCDLIFGAGSNLTAILRSPELLSTIRKEVEWSFFNPKASSDDRKFRLLRLFHLADMVTVNCKGDIGTKTNPADISTKSQPSCAQLRFISGFIWQGIAEPIFGLERELDKSPIAEPSEVRDILRKMAFNKVSYDAANDVLSSTAGSPAVRIDNAINNGNGVSDGLPYFMSAYMSGMPRRTATVSGYSKSQIEATKARVVTCLPSQLPAVIRAANSELFNLDLGRGVTSLSILSSNQNHWSDGSNILVALAGAIDTNGSVIPKKALAALAQKAIKDQFMRYGEAKNLILPVFKGDKNSAYALQIPIGMTTTWVRMLLDNPAAISSLSSSARKNIENLKGYLEAVLPEFKAYLTERAAKEKDPEKKRDLEAVAAGAKLLSILESLPKNANQVSSEGLLKKSFDSLESIEEKAMYLRGKFYDVVFQIVANATGQDRIDAKRTPVLVSAGPMIPFCKRTSEAPSYAGYYRTTIVGGQSAGAMMGGWFIHGLAADAISAMSEKGKAQAQKIHVFSLEDGVDFDKGQAHDYGLGLETDEASGLGCVSWWQKQMCRNVLRAMQQAGIDVDMEAGLNPPVPPSKEEADINPEAWNKYRTQLARYRGNVEKYKEFCGHSTFGLTDTEIHKAGSFGSRAGIRCDGKTLVINGVELLKDGKPSDSIPSWFQVVPEIKNGACPIAWALSAYAAATGKDLSNEDTMGITADWVLPNGNIVENKSLKESGILPADAQLSFFRQEEDGAVAMQFYTKQMIAQVVANNSSPSTVSDSHSFATNLTRDVEIDASMNLAYNTLRRGSIKSENSPSFVESHTLYGLLSLVQTIANTNVIPNALKQDQELLDLLQNHPNDPEVVSKAIDKVKAFLAKQTIPNYHGNHGVMVASGLKFIADSQHGDPRFSHLGTIERAPGVDNYTFDCFRPAYLFTSKQLKAIRSVMNSYIDRTYASGCVNVDQPGFRYGMYANEARLMALMNNDWVKKNISAFDAERAALAQGFGQESADQMVLIATIITGIKNNDADCPKDTFMQAFESYIPNQNVQREDVRFDDLFLPNGKFDFAAIECGSRARMSRSGKKCTYIGGSFFAAHRSPSGNIEAFSGLVRAVAPITYDKNGYSVGSESKYALDPVTTATQGSDTDGDSAGIQVFDYTLDSDEKLTTATIHDFLVECTKAPITGVNLAETFLQKAKEYGWTTEKDGQTTLKPNILSLLNRNLFLSQIENYRNSPTRHQGYSSNNKWNNTVVDGSVIADEYEGMEAGNTRLYDYGFTGRSPVGTDAVFSEPISAEKFEQVLGTIGLSTKEVPYKEGYTWTDLLNKTVDYYQKGGTTMDVAESAAEMADASSDSADARGVSVFHQVRFLRALIGNAIEGRKDTGHLGWGAAAISAVRPDGYSPLADFVAHLDGISNNLFDTLKKMFATRAGWTQEMLPLLITRIVYNASPTERLDNEYFATQMLKFLAELHDSKSTLGIYKRLSDPTNGLDAYIQMTGNIRDDKGQRITSIQQASRMVRETPGAEDEESSLGGLDNLAAVLSGEANDEAAVERILTQARMLKLMKEYGELTDFPVLTKADFKKLMKGKARLEEDFAEVLKDLHFPASSLGGKNLSFAAQTIIERVYTEYLTKFANANTESFIEAVRDAADKRNTERAETPELAKPVYFNTKLAFNNYQRLQYLYGATQAFCNNSKIVSDYLKKLSYDHAVTENGVTTNVYSTQKLFDNLAAIVKELSKQALKASTGIVEANDGGKSIKQFQHLFSSLFVDQGIILLRAGNTNEEREALREEFGILLRASKTKFAVGTNHEINGSNLAKLIILAEFALNPFNATTDYVGRSDLTSIFPEEVLSFGSSKLRELQAKLLQADESLVTMNLAQVGDKKKGSHRAFDLVNALTKGLFDTPADLDLKTTPVTELTQSLIKADKTTLRLSDTADTANLVEEKKIPSVDEGFARPFRTALRIPAMKGALQIKGRAGVYDSLEEALNAWMEFSFKDYQEKENARKFFESYTRSNPKSRRILDYRDPAGKWGYGYDSPTVSIAKGILRRAVEHNRDVYDFFSNISPEVTKITTGNKVTDLAYNAILNEVRNGNVNVPSSNPALMVSASTQGGNTRRIDATSVLRSGYLHASETLYPGYSKRAREQAQKSVPAAIEAAFTRVFGDSVKVTMVTNDKGEDTNLLRIERTVEGKKVITYIAFGETIRISHKDRRTIQSIVEAINSEREKAGVPPLDAETIMNLPESERELFVKLAASKMTVQGSSAGLESIVKGTGLEFAGAMSGLIRLDANASYSTLFHEYFHQMLSCFRALGISTAEDEAELKAQFHDDSGAFNEEQAADAYASYITGVNNPRTDDDLLRNYFTQRGTIEKKTEKIFEKMRTMSEMLAEASIRGTTADGLPVFARCTLYTGLTKEEIDKIKTPESIDVKNVERILLDQKVEDAPSIPNATTPELELKISQAYNKLLKEDVPVKDTLRELSTALDSPIIPDPKPPFNPMPDRAPRPRPTDSPLAKVQNFFNLVLHEFSTTDGTYANLDDMKDDLEALRVSMMTPDLASKSVAVNYAVRNVRRLIREVALANGIDIEEVNSKGELVLTEFGKAIMMNENINELALRLMANAHAERKSLEGLAENAGADWAFARALERVMHKDAPPEDKVRTYYHFAIRQAERSRDMFLTARKSALTAAEAREKAGDHEVAKRYRELANLLAGRALTVMQYADMIARGKDLHAYFPKIKDNPGNLHGMVFKHFSGGAILDPIQMADGIRRYKPGSGYLGFDFEDPIIQAAFDYANMAFFVAEAAQNFEGDKFTPIAPEGEGAPVKRMDEKDAKTATENVQANIEYGLGVMRPMAPVKETEPVDPTLTREFDTGAHGVEWILANPGTWLASDMQKDFAGVSLRAMMTDHQMQAATENAYALATTMLQIFGADCYAGDRLRYMELAKSDLGRNERGDFAYTKNGKNFIRFSHTTGIFFGTINFDAKRVGKEATKQDLQMTNFIMQMIRHAANGDRKVATDIDIGFLANERDLKKLRKIDISYSPRAVLDRVLKNKIQNKQSSALDILLYRLMQALPREVVGEVCHGGYNEKGDIIWNDWDGKDIDIHKQSGLYCRILSVIDDVLQELGSTKISGDKINTLLVDALRNEGLIHTGDHGRRNVVALNINYLKKVWDDSHAKQFLIEGGRPKELLDFDYWRGEISREVSKLNRVAAKSSYLRNGAGSTLTLAASPISWFHSGTGAHVLDVQKYQTVMEAIKQEGEFTEAELRKSHASLFSVLDSIGTTRLNEGAFTIDGKCDLTNSQVLYLADLFGLNTKADAGFSIDSFIQDIYKGKYADGRVVPGVSIDKNSTKADIILTINRIVNEKVAEGLGGGLANAPTLRSLVAMSRINDRISDKLNRLIPGRILVRSDLEQFEKTGELGTSWTAPEAMMQMCKELVAAEKFRSCLAQMLTSVSYDGTMNYIVDPSEYASTVNNMPDEYWGALARTTIARSGWCKNLPAYDEGKSGVENMKAVYKAIRDSNEGRYNKPMDVAKFGAYPLFDGILCRKSDADSAGNVDELSQGWGGEAECYMRQLLGLVKAPSTGSVLRQIERIMSWSKLASVGFSAFFQISTAFESQMAATGFTDAFLSNFPGTTGVKLGRAIGKALGRSGGLGAFQADALSFKDIIENINSNDPFIVELREMCALMGMPLDQSIDYAMAENQSNPALGQGGIVKRDIETVYRWAQKFNLKGAGNLKSFLMWCYQHPTDYTFNVVLNGVKMAVVAQTMRRLREECLAGHRPFDPVKELRKYAPYINAEIGGVDPGAYAWAHPQMQRVLHLSMFSWQWTVGAWVAGSGEMITDMIFGGHSTTRASRQYAFTRWMQMLGYVKFGVPFVLQITIKALAKVLSKVIPPPDDPEEEEDEKNVPWFMWNNESKVGSLCFDVTPLLKLAARIPGVKDARETKIPVPVGAAIGGILGYMVFRNPLVAAATGVVGGGLIPQITTFIPAYTGGGRNTTGNRRYYMHFGKQSDEFFRYFDGIDGALKQLLSKGSTGVQALSQLIFGHTLAANDVTEDSSRLAGFVKMFMPFSLQGILQNADAGILAAVGPIKMGASKRSIRLRIVERLNDIISKSGTNDPFSNKMNRRKLNLMCTDILREAQLNGVNPETIFTSALGDVIRVQYLKLMGSLPKDAANGKIDAKTAAEAVRALTICNRKAKDILRAVENKYKDAGTDAKKNPYFMQALKDMIRNTQVNPYLDDEYIEKRFQKWFEETGDSRNARSTTLANKGGENLGNFLATDQVPVTLFGVPIVIDNYRSSDLQFFKEYPEAGGFYDLGTVATPKQSNNETPTNEEE